jgi:hypothetical protein
MKAVTREDVKAYQEKFSCGVNCAKRGVEHINATEAIETATSVEDLKVVLLFILNR